MSFVSLRRAKRVINVPVEQTKLLLSNSRVRFVLTSHRICFIALIVCVANVAAQRTINIPKDQPTIQSGINAAANGDTVLVAPGTYYENIDFKGKAITVTSSAGAARTIIDGGQKGPVAQFLSGELRSSVLSDFTLQHGRASGGVTAGSEGQYSAGVLMQNSAPTIISNIIKDNYCYGVDAETASPLLQNNTISGTNYYVTNSCDAVAIGAGILIDGALGEQSELLGGTGNGPYTPALLPTIVGNIIENNNDLEDASASGGGGIHVLFGDTIIENNIVRNNYSTQPGGGIAVSNYNYSYYDTLVIAQNLIYGNTSACGGGGIAFNQSTVAQIGPPFYWVENNTIVDNINANNCADRLTPKGSQVYLWQDSNRFVFANNIIAGSSSTDPPVYCETLRAYYPAYDLAVFDHNDFYNPLGSPMDGQCANQVGSYGNLNTDPKFVDRAAADFQLTAQSPLIDAGNDSGIPVGGSGALLTQDFASNPRFADATTAGYPIIDIGAYEFVGPQDAEASLMSLTPSSYQVSVGESLTLTADLRASSYAPGTISFYEDNVYLGSSNYDGSGVASFVTAPTMPGVHAFVAKWGGSSTVPPCFSVKIFVVVGSVQSLLSLTSSVNPQTYGQPVTFNVAASSTAGPVPSPIVLTDGTTTLQTLTPDGNGQASYTTSALAVGSHAIAANYAGNSTLPAAQATLTQLITAPPTTATPTNTTLASAPNPSARNQSVTFTAHVGSANGTPTGSVQFFDGLSSIGSVLLDVSGNATLSTSSLVIGKHTITAIYSPIGTFSSSQGTVTQVVTPLTSVTGIFVLPVNATYGTAIGISLDVHPASGVTPVPSGMVTLLSNGVQVASGTLDTAGKAQFSISTLPIGTDSISAVYGGDNTFASSTSAVIPVAITGSATRLVISPHANPAPALLTNYYFSLILTAGGTPLPGQTVTFTVSGYPSISGVTDATGQAYFTTPFTLHTGNYALTGSFAGSTNYAASAAQSFDEVIFPDRTTTSLTAPATTVPQNSTLTLSSAIVDIDTGNAFTAGASAANGVLNFYDGTTLLGSTSPQASSAMNASGQFNVANLSLGMHTLVATFAPASGDIATSSSAPLVITVSPADFSLSLSQPALTIQAEHHASILAALSSSGGFTGNIALSCGALPAEASCNFVNQVLYLPADGAATTQLIIDTDAVHYFKSSTTAPRDFLHSNSSRLALALLLPISLATLARRRNAFRLLGIGILACTIFGISGCGDMYPAHTPPGTYSVVVSATGTPQNGTTPLTHRQTLTLVVTP